MNKLIIRHDFKDIKIGGRYFYVTNLFKRLLKGLIERYPEIDFEVVRDADFEKYGYGGICSCMNFSIFNPSNGKYILISFFDNWKYHFMSHIGWDAKNMCQFLYPGGFNFYDYFTFKEASKHNSDLTFPKNIEKVYTPFYYGPYFDACYDEMKMIYENVKPFEITEKKIEKLYFRGWLWDFREEMVKGIEEMADDIIIIDKNKESQNLDYLDYLFESKKYTATLSLPGGNEICNRDIECFGIGAPVIRPSVNISYEDPLIPNYHYISCYDFCDYSMDGHPKFISNQDFRKNVVATWKRVKPNKEYLDFVSSNARSWFERNCTLDKNLEFVLNKINLELLA